MSEAIGTNFSSAADREVLKQKAVAAKEAVVDLASEAGRFAAHRASDLKEHAADWTHSAKERVGDVNSQVLSYVRHNPYKSIAIAAGVGLLVGMLLKRR